MQPQSHADIHRTPHTVLALMRPVQWTKNLAVFAGILFAGEVTNAQLLLVACLAFVAFCLVSSGMYAINDAVDADRDRQHPIKRSRPVACGAITPTQATAIGVVLLAVGGALSLYLGLPFLLVVLGYAAVHLLYTVWLKHVAIVDMLCIASGFVLRAVGGAVVISVPVSPWLILCTGLLALFLAAAKRRHEVVLLQGTSGEHRPVLDEYSAELLDSFMVTLSAATVTSYALYTFFETRSPYHAMMLTIPFVIYGVLRYQSLVLRGDKGGRPEDVLLTDVPILMDVVLWVLSAVFAIYVLPLLVH